MFLRRILPLLILFAPLSSFAQWATWQSPVAQIVYTKCTQCHHNGGIAPFALESYSDAVSNNLSMQAEVNAGHMPPWPPDNSYRKFAHDRSLTPAEKDAINDWVNHGTPSGDLSLAPAAPVFTSAWEIPSPDVSVRMPEYTSPAATDDEYHCFVMPSGVTTDKYISEIEVIPGNRQAVHHVLVFQDPSGDCAALDAATPEVGYTSFGDAGSANAQLIGLWAPGGSKFSLPAGMGLKLNANADIVIQVHYPKGSDGMLDSTRVNIKFADGSFIREVYLDPLLYHDLPCINTPLVIPANTTKSFVETTNTSLISPVKGSLLAVAPHMHLIGTQIKSFGVGPTGDTIPFINIPNWNFHWQGMYFFQYVQPVEVGANLKAVAFYDNTDANPLNPNSPPALVHLGEATTDEMMLVYFLYTYYLPGDEDILQDSSVLYSSIPASESQQRMHVYPNPADEQTLIEMPVDDAVQSIELYSMDGRLVREEKPAKMHYYPMDVHDLPSGIYEVRMQAGQKVYSNRLVIQHGSN